MRDKFHVSFEVLHLVSTISQRFNVIFERSGLSREKMYALSYIHAFGIEISVDNIAIRIFQRSRLVKIIMEVFRCDRTKTNKLINEMRKAGLIRVYELTPEEKSSYYGDGQNETLYLTEKGMAKLSAVIGDLTTLLGDLISRDSRMLLPPDASQLGFVASKIVWLLKRFVRSARSADVTNEPTIVLTKEG